MTLIRNVFLAALVAFSVSAVPSFAASAGVQANAGAVNVNQLLTKIGVGANGSGKVAQASTKAGETMACEQKECDKLGLKACNNREENGKVCWDCCKVDK